MKTITSYNDIHLYGPHELDIGGWDFRDPSHYYLGDNVDVALALRKDVNNAITSCREMAFRFEGRCVSGNHELEYMGKRTPPYLVVGQTLLTHGDWLFWDDARAYAYRFNKRPGIGKLRRYFTVGYWDFVRHVLRPGITPLFTQKVLKLASHYGVKMVVCGHQHPPKRIETKIGGIYVTVLPRGKNVVEIMA